MEQKDRLNAVIKAIKLRYGYDSNEDILLKMGYKNKNYISDMDKISEKFTEKLSEFFRVSADYIFKGVGHIFSDGCYLPESDLEHECVEVENENLPKANTIIAGHVSGNGNNISHNDSDNIAGMISLQKGYQDLLKKSQEQIDRLIGIIEKGGNDD